MSPTTVKPLLTGKVVTAAQLLQSFKNASNNSSSNSSSSKQNYISIDNKIESLTAKNAKLYN